MGGPLTGATSEISLCMPPTCSRLYRKNDMSNFCIYAGLVGIFFPQLNHSDWYLVLLPEECTCLAGKDPYEVV